MVEKEIKQEIGGVCTTVIVRKAICLGLAVAMLFFGISTPAYAQEMGDFTEPDTGDLILVKEAPEEGDVYVPEDPVDPVPPGWPDEDSPLSPVDEDEVTTIVTHKDEEPEVTEEPEEGETIEDQIEPPVVDLEPPTTKTDNEINLFKEVFVQYADEDMEVTTVSEGDVSTSTFVNADSRDLLGTIVRNAEGYFWYSPHDDRPAARRLYDADGVLGDLEIMEYPEEPELTPVEIIQIEIEIIDEEIDLVRDEIHLIRDERKEIRDQIKELRRALKGSSKKERKDIRNAIDELREQRKVKREEIRELKEERKALKKERRELRKQLREEKRLEKRAVRNNVSSTSLPVQNVSALGGSALAPELE